MFGSLSIATTEMPRYDILLISKSKIAIEGIWVIKAKSKKKAKKKFKELKVAQNYEIVSVKRHKLLPGEEC